MSELINQSGSSARAAILESIRSCLAQSGDAVSGKQESAWPGNQLSAEDSVQAASENGPKVGATSPVEMFRESLEAVGGHCMVVRSDVEAALALNQIIQEFQAISFPARRIALSDAAVLVELSRGIDAGVEELAFNPSTADLFGFDIGITTAQAAIAETGTLVLESARERNRLVSLLPPAHIAIVNAENICLSFGDALKQLRGAEHSEMSRAITFITGPSRTADIELTLTIGVHGPKELYVVIIDNSASSD